MLAQQWYAVCPVKAVGKKPLALVRFGKKLVLWRDAQGEIRCALDACAHRGAALSRGRVMDGCITCPYHGLRFDETGRCMHIPAHPHLVATEALQLRVYRAEAQRGLVWVWNGRAEEATSLPWDDAFQEQLDLEETAYVDLSDSLPVSYLRVMENLTDYHHVAHVHRRTAPVPAEVLSFEATREGMHIRTSALLGDAKGRRFEASTHIVAPFLAQLHFAGLARFAVVATPIDDANVWLFARYTQTAVRIPGLNGLLTRLLGLFDYRLLQRWEDLPVWQSQMLDAPGDVSRYHLLPADEGVRHYFELHQELAGG